jgi:hypothetical protein
VISAVVAIMAIGLLWLLGSESAPLDQAIAKVGPWILMILLVFPAVWVWEFLLAPARIEKDTTNVIRGQEIELKKEIDNLKGVIEDLRMQVNPELITRSPSYIRLHILINPETGTLSPEQSLHCGSEEFNKLFALASEGDLESYYVAASTAEWILANARRYYASSSPYFEIQNYVLEKLDIMHDRFKVLPIIPRMPT